MQRAGTLKLSLWALILISHAASAQIIGLAGTGSAADHLGEAVVAGDFNCDSYDDLAAYGSRDNAINVVYGGTGSGNKLGTPGNVQFGLDAMIEVASGFDSFDVTLAAGDFDGNGCYDLAIGMPDATVGSVFRAGHVIVLYGDLGGLDHSAPQIWHQDVPGVADTAQVLDHFGWSLAVGDFNHDHFHDLAIGIPHENGIGAVYVLHGQPLAGLSSLLNRFFTQDSSGMLDTGEAGDKFGWSLATGDFDDNGYHDLAVGVPDEDLDGVSNAGAVQIIYSSSTSLSSSGNQLWHQGAAGILDSKNSGDRFGYTLAAGDFDNTGTHDLAVGVPFEGYRPPAQAPDTFTSVGAIQVLYGGSRGLVSDWNQIFRADAAGIPVGRNAFFGWSFAVGDFDNDNFDDLAIGAPGDFFGNNLGGSVYILNGNRIFSTSDSRFLDQGLLGVEGNAERDDEFGFALAAGDFNRDGRADLAVGVPNETYNGVALVGAAQVFYFTGSSVVDPVNDQIFVQ